MPQAVIVTDTNSIPLSGSSSPVSYQRPNDTTAYTAGDVVGSSTSSGGAVLTFASLRGGGAGEFMITSASLEIDLAAIPSGMTTFGLALYSGTPPSAYGDNTAWDLPSGDRSVFIDKITLGAPADLGSTLFISSDSINKQISCTASGVYGYLVTDSGYTPAAQTNYKIALHGFAL